MRLLGLGVALAGALVALAGCNDPAVRLYNPRTGMVATCDVNRAVDVSYRANDRCAQGFEQQGYVRGWPPPR